MEFNSVKRRVQSWNQGLMGSLPTDVTLCSISREEAQWGALHHMVKQNREESLFFSSNAEAIWEINAGCLGDPPRDNVQLSNCSALFFSHDGVFPGWVVQGPRLEKQKMHAAHRGGIPLSKTDTVLCSLVPLTLNLFYDSFDLDVTQSGCQKNTSFFWKSSQLELCYWSVAEHITLQQGHSN